MNIETQFPCRFYINLGRSDERRQKMDSLFMEQGLEIPRQPAIHGNWLRSGRDYANTNRRAVAMSKRLTIRRARAAGASSLLLMEDDLIFHPEWRERLEGITLPDDWGIFMLGAIHLKKPDVVSPGLVRCKFAVDHHAVAFRACHFTAISKAMRPSSDMTEFNPNMTSDVRVAKLMESIPAYAAWPNLVWQDNPHYDASGSQTLFPEAIPDCV